MAEHSALNHRPTKPLTAPAIARTAVSHSSQVYRLESPLV